METNVLRDGPIFTVNGKPALMLASNDEVFAGLMFRHQDAKLQMATFRRKQFADIRPLDNCGTGMLGLFRATMLWNKTYLDLNQACIDDITQGDPSLVWQLAREACGLGAYMFAARIASTITHPGHIELLIRDEPSPVPPIMKVALLPYLGSADVRKVVDMAHSRHWKATYAGDDWNQERYATTAAYVFAEHNGIPVDDPEGVQSVRSGLFLQSLLRSGLIPWVGQYRHPNEV